HGRYTVRFTFSRRMFDGKVIKAMLFMHRVYTAFYYASFIPLRACAG
ncbi:MAG: hypothetical protein ACI8TV_000844, partial [Porticoccaceae bacterium]